MKTCLKRAVMRLKHGSAHEPFSKQALRTVRSGGRGRGGPTGTDRTTGRQEPWVALARRNQWIQRHKRFHLHFIPTSSSWLNLVERWFGEITRKRIRRGVFKSVKDLIEAIESYLTAYNNDPMPLVWTASAESILEKVRR